jgi:hypothetical protein
MGWDNNINWNGSQPNVDLQRRSCLLIETLCLRNGMDSISYNGNVEGIFVFVDTFDENGKCLVYDNADMVGVSRYFAENNVTYWRNSYDIKGWHDQHGEQDLIFLNNPIPSGYRKGEIISVLKVPEYMINFIVNELSVPHKLNVDYFLIKKEGYFNDIGSGWSEVLAVLQELNLPGMDVHDDYDEELNELKKNVRDEIILSKLYKCFDKLDIFKKYFKINHSDFQLDRIKYWLGSKAKTDQVDGQFYFMNDLI